jgi:hypothetical protein
MQPTVAYDEEGKTMRRTAALTWAMLLVSLEQLVETGAGQPAPRDVKISDGR